MLIAERDKEEMDAEVADELAKLRTASPRDGGKLSVVTRQGCPTELENMDRVAAGTAKRLILTQPSEADPAEQAEQRLKQQQAAVLALSLQQRVQPQAARRANMVISVLPTKEPLSPIVE